MLHFDKNNIKNSYRNKFDIRMRNHPNKYIIDRNNYIIILNIFPRIIIFFYIKISRLFKVEIFTLLLELFICLPF